MYEGIKVENGGNTVDLNNLPQTEAGELILDGVDALKIFVDEGAAYVAAKFEILENNNDIRISFLDSEGNEIFMILKNLNDILLANADEIPVFEVFDGGENILSMATIEDLQAAAAGGPTSDISTADALPADPLDLGTDLDAPINPLGFGGLAGPFVVDPSFPLDVTFSGDLTATITEDIGESEEGVITGLILNDDPHYGPFGYIPQTIAGAYGTFTIDADGNWTYDLDETLEDVQGLADDESLLEGITITLDNLITTFTINITINGLNDKPEIEDIDINALQGELVDNEEEPNEEPNEEVNGNNDIVNVGYYDMSVGAGATNQVDSIENAGLNPVNITAPNAIELNALDILYVQNPSNSSYGSEYLSLLDDIEDAVSNGMTLVIHDRFVTNGANILPGGEDIVFDRDFDDAAEIEITDDGAILEEGLAGSIDDDSLDGGNWSSHGYVEIDSLPAGATVLLTNGNPDQVVTFSYPYGNGTVVYSTIPLDHYLDQSDSGIQENMDIYAANLLEELAELRKFVLYETSSQEDVLGVDDTESEANNIYNGEIGISDADINNTHILTIVDETLEVTSPEDSEGDPIITLDDITVSLDLNEETGEWEYNINGDFGELALGERATLTFQYQADDQRGFAGDPGDDDTTNEDSLSDPKTITLTITGTNDKPVIEAHSGEIPGEVVSGNGTTTIVATGNIVQENEEEDSGSIDYWHFTHNGGALTIDMLTEYGDDFVDVDGDNIQSELDSYIYLFRDTGAFDEDSLVDSDDDSDVGDTPGLDDGEADGSTHSYDSYLSLDDLPAGNYVLVVGGYDLELEAIQDGINEDSDYAGPYQITLTSENGATIVPGSGVITINEATNESLFEQEEFDEEDGEVTSYIGTINGVDNDVNDTHEISLVDTSLDDGDVAIEINTDEEDSFIGKIVIDTEASPNYLDVSDFEPLEVYFDEIEDEDGEFSYEYEFSGNFDALGVGESATITFSYVVTDNQGVLVTDGTNEASQSEVQTITIRVIGTNDQPEIDDITEQVAIARESIMETYDDEAYDNGLDDTQDDVGTDPSLETTTTYTEVITGIDDDDNDTHTISLVNRTGVNDYTLTSGGVVQVELDAEENAPDQLELGDLTFDISFDPVISEDGEFESAFTLAGDFNALAAGETATITFDYKVTDSSGAEVESEDSEVETVRLIVTGTNDQPIVETLTYSIEDNVLNEDEDNVYYETHDKEDVIGEDDTKDEENNILLGTLVVTDDDITDTHTFHVDDMPALDEDVDGDDITLVDIDYFDGLPVVVPAFQIPNGDNGYPEPEPPQVTVQLESEDVDVDNIHLESIRLLNNDMQDRMVDFELEGDFSALAEGETATVTFSYYAKDDSDASDESDTSELKTVTLTVTGTNDQPVVENMVLGSLNTGFWNLVAQGASLSTIEALANMSITNDGSTPTDGSAVKFNVKTMAGETVIFEWDFIDAETPSGFSINDFSFVIIDGQLMTLEDVLDVDVNGNTILSHQFATAGEHSIVFGVMNSLDSFVDSSLNLEHISGGIVLSSTSVGNVSEQANLIYETSDLDANDADDNGVLRDDEPINTLSGVLTVTDEDINDKHLFDVIDMPNGQTIDFYVDDDDTIVDGQRTVLVESNDVDASDIVLSAIKFLNNDEQDRSIGFEVDGDFSALGADETAVITFKYNASDNSDNSITPGENNTSETKTVTIIVTGTNDQPVVYAQVHGIDDPQTLEDERIYETHDDDAYQNGEDDTQDDTTNTLSGTLLVTDDDVNDRHLFSIVSMAMVAGTQDIKVVDVSYDDEVSQNGSDAPVKIQVESTDVDVANISIDSISLFNNDGDDREVDFSVVGDFNALGVDETATITFKFVADDLNGFDGTDGLNENSVSEPKTVTITVTGTNDQPIITNIETIEALEGEDLASITYGADIDVPLSQIAYDSQEGSALKAVIDTAAGETVSFDWDFSSMDVSYDSMAIIVDGVVMEQADVTSAIKNGTFEYTFGNAGEHTIVFVVSNDRFDDGNTVYNAELDVSLNPSSEGVIISTETFGAVSGSNQTGWNLSANSNESVQALDDFIDLEEVTYENAHLSGTLEDVITVHDDDDNDDYSYIAFDDKIVDFTEVTNGDPIITTPIRVSLDEYGNYDVISSSFDKLGFGEQVIITFNVYVKDDSGVDENGDPLNEASLSEPKIVTIVIDGTNDTPVLHAVSTADVLETDLTGLPFLGGNWPENSFLSAQIDANISDEDYNDSHTFVEQGTYNFQNFDPAFANVVDPHGVINGPVFLKVNEDGTFKLFNPNFNKLGVDEEVTVSFDVQVTDGTNDPNGEGSISNTQTVTFTVSGTNDQPVVENMNFLGPWGGYESLGDGETIFNGNFEGSDEDKNDQLTFNALSIDANELVTDVAGAGYVRVSVPYDSDGNGAYESNIDIAVKLSANSEVDINDLDFTGIKINGSDFTLVGDFNALPAGETMMVKFLYNANDDSGSDGTNGIDETAISDTKMVTISIAGTNDDANITVGLGQGDGDVVEDVLFQTDGQLGIADLDAGEAEFDPVFTVHPSNATSYGTFIITASGAWQYTLSNSSVQGLNGGDVVEEKYIVHSEDGTDSTVITIRIHGAEDPSNIYLESEVDSDTGMVQEDVAVVNDILSTGGTLSISDDDTGDEFFSTNVNPAGTTLGTLEIDQNGIWSYEVDNTLAQVQALGVGETIIEEFEVSSIDPNSPFNDTHIITVTIKGTNDEPQITVDSNDSNAQFVEMAGNDTGANAVQITNTISISDLDGDNIKQAVVKIDNLQDGDELLYVNAYGITGSYDSNSGELTLTAVSVNGEDVGTFAAALNSIMFNNTSNTPDVTTREIDYRVEDIHGGWSNIATEYVDVMATNDDPKARNNFDDVVEKGVGVPPADNLEGNVIDDPNPNNNKVDSDPDGDSLEVVRIESLNSGDIDTTFNNNAIPKLVVDGEYGVLKVAADGTYTYNLKDNWQATNELPQGAQVQDEFKYKITDGNNGFDTAKLIINITGTNDRPKLDSEILDSVATEDQAYSYDVSGYFSDVDLGDSLTFSATLSNGAPLPSWLTISPAGVLSGEPENDDVGSINVKVIATDMYGASKSDVFTLTINNVNDAPEIISITENQSTIYEDNVIAGATTETTPLVTVDVEDDDGPTENFNIISGNGAGYFEIDSNGVITLTQAGKDAIADSLVNNQTFNLGVEVSDGHPTNPLTDVTTVQVEVKDNFVDIPTIDLPAAQDTGTLDDDDFTSENLPTFDLGNIAADAVSIKIIDGNNVLQAQAVRSSVLGLWVLDNSSGGELIYNSGLDEWQFAPDSALADGMHTFKVVVLDDAGNEAHSSLTIEVDASGPVVDATNIQTEVNETLSDIELGQVTATDDNGPVSFSVDNLDFEIDTNGNLKYIGDPLDFEASPSHTVNVTVTDIFGNETVEEIVLEVDNVTGTVTTSAGNLVAHNFNGGNNHGWLINGQGNSSNEETGFKHNGLGLFKEAEVVSHSFNFADHAGESVMVKFDVTFHEPGGFFWNKGSDTLTVTINGNDTILSEYDGTYAISIPATLTASGDLNISFNSSTSAQAERWGIDNFEVYSATGGEQILTLDEEGEIDMAVLLSQANDFTPATPNSLDEIDLSGGDHILSNIRVEDVITMTDGDYTLKIEGDGSDSIELDLNEWQVKSPDSVNLGADEDADGNSDGYVTYTNISAVGSVTAGSVQLLIDEDIDVKF